MQLSSGEVPLDALILATGYDGLTGALMAFEVRGRDGRDLRDKWQHGAHSWLGLMLAGFPNLFMVCGANGPAALANIISIDEQNVDWIIGLMRHMEDNGLATVEPTPAAEDRWMDLVAELAEKTLLSKANTWYTGGNIAGKTRGLTMFTGGFANYSEHCRAGGGRGVSGTRLRTGQRAGRGVRLGRPTHSVRPEPVEGRWVPPCFDKLSTNGWVGRLRRPLNPPEAQAFRVCAATPPGAASAAGRGDRRRRE
ncbi:MAG: hypothetical protein PGN08_09970 [Sphingomonas taxi]